MLNAAPTTNASVRVRCRSSAISTYCVTLLIHPITIDQMKICIAMAPCGRYAVPPRMRTSTGASSVVPTASGTLSSVSSLTASTYARRSASRSSTAWRLITGNSDSVK